MKTIALANSVATAFGLFYVGCLVLTLIAPDLVFNIARGWFHNFNLDVVKPTGGLDIGSSFLGLVSYIVTIWVVTYLSATFYNNWSGKR